eukprot:Hpha_TRINITY_DN4847_c0_g1::TRINITY_DN4847_c0_g1_i1::g.20160::m.20160
MSGAAWVPLSQPEQLWDRELAKTMYSTHLRVWPGAASLLRWLEANSAEAGVSEKGARVLELGSGTGWLGLSLARNLPMAESVTLTDLPHCVPRLAEAIRTCPDLPQGPRVHACPLDWAAHAPHEREGNAPPSPTACVERDAVPRPTVVIGSDLVWTQETAKLLPWGVRGVLESAAPGTRCLYGHWDRGFRSVYVTLWEEMERAQICIEQLYPMPEDYCASQEADSGDENPWEANLFADCTTPETPVFVVYSLTIPHPA